MAAHRTLLAVAAMTVATALMLVAPGSAHAAGAVSRSGSVLTYTSDPGSQDRLAVLQTNATTIVFDDAATNVRVAGAPGCVVSQGNVGCVNVVWTQVIVNLGDQSDTVTGQQAPFPVSIPMRVNGGAGQDVVTGGLGNDALLTGADGGVLDGGPGSDTLRAESATGRANLRGGPGDDIIDLRPHTSPNGGEGIGGEGNDSLFAAPTGSALQGDAGDDTLTGGPGNDELFGGPGSDQLDAAGGNDDLDGGDGIDTLRAGDGNDDVSGGFAIVNNTAVSDGPDTMSGGPGLDRINYAQRTAPVRVDLATAGGDGQAGENDDTAADFEAVIGGGGDDTLLGDGGPNRIEGGRGQDTIDGRGGIDELFGDADADTITATGDSVADLVVCGNSATANQPPLANGSDLDTANLDHLDILGLFADCETLNREAPPQLPTQAGSPRPDVLVGSNQAQELRGGGGNDVLRGRGGNDRLRGGPGHDRLFGGLGNDDLDGDAGNDRLFGERGNDALDGGPGADLLYGGPGRDSLVGGPGRDRLDGGAQRDFLMARDGRAGDVVICSKVNLATRVGRLQRDIVVADRRDTIRNRAWCARVTFT